MDVAKKIAIEILTDAPEFVSYWLFLASADVITEESMEGLLSALPYHLWRIKESEDFVDIIKIFREWIFSPLGSFKLKAIMQIMEHLNLADEKEHIYVFQVEHTYKKLFVLIFEVLTLIID